MGNSSAKREDEKTAALNKCFIEFKSKYINAAFYM